MNSVVVGHAFAALLWVGAGAVPRGTALPDITPTPARGVTYDVVELGVQVPEGVSTGAFAVNEHRQAVGWVGGMPAVFSPRGHARVFDDKPGVALRIDAAGAVEGRRLSDTAGQGRRFAWKDGRWIDAAIEANVSTDNPTTSHRALALDGAATARLHGRNERGHAVGESDAGLGTASRAVLRRDGRVVDLSALPEARASGWRHLWVAYAINEDGVIVGLGERANGDTRGFMLVPRALSQR
jgi:uncharacterized membrane protein